MQVCPHIAWRFVFFVFGFMGFFWTFMWIATYRDFAISMANLGDEEAFIHPSLKVKITLAKNSFDDVFFLALIICRLAIKTIDGLNLFHIGHSGQSISLILR